jgi:D-alanine transaminase/branched-chain amino acid aminotransferase
MEQFSFVTDKFVPAGQASLQVSDLAIQRGYGIFDFFKTLNGAALYLDDHLDRLFYSAGRMRLEVGMSREELKAVIAELMERNGIADSGIRLTLTGGYSADGYTPARSNLVIQQSPLTSAVGAEPVQSIALMTYAHQRQLPDVKTIDYLMAVWLQPLLREKGVDDVLYHHNGVVAECPRSNFFLVTAEGTLVTPAANVLKGITRMKVLEVAKGQFATEERDVLLDELRTAKEAFITSTTKHVLPVTVIDGLPVGNGMIGPLARQLSAALYQLGAPSAPQADRFI